MGFRDMTTPNDDDSHNDNDSGAPGTGPGVPGGPAVPGNPGAGNGNDPGDANFTPPFGFGNFPNNSGMPININIGGGTQPADPDEAKEHLVDYNERFKNAHPALFRDAVVNQTIEILMSKTKPNALLVGAAGVGKTMVVEDIARRIAQGDVPDQLKTATIYELPISSLISGASLVGQLEERIEGIIKFASDPDNQAILFIDEIHQITKDGDHTLNKIAQMLKPALARGDMHVIGATTSQEARQLDSDPAFKRRFSQCIVAELSAPQTRDVIEHVLPTYIAHYRGVVDVNTPSHPDEATVLDTIVAYADEYNRVKNHRPDNALTLLDKAMSHVARMHQEMQSQGVPVPNTLPLTEATVIRIAKQLMTGHIEHNLTDMKQLAKNLSVIQGQDHVIEQVLRRIRGRDIGAFPQRVPMSWLFAGASGVGKTRVAEIVAETLTHTTPIMLNMAEYHESSSINRIIGSPAGYVGSDSNKEKPLDSLESNPYQVIVLDEFEKAHRDVQNLFLAAFDKGVIDTASGKTIDLSKAIVVATTNAGRDTLGKAALGFNTDGGNNSAAVLKPDEIAKQLGQAFPKELVARFSYVTAFNRISREVYTACLVQHYEREYARIAQTKPLLAQNLSEVLDDKTVAELVESSYVADHGVRPARRAVENYITETLIDAGM